MPGKSQHIRMILNTNHAQKRLERDLKVGLITHLGSLRNGPQVMGVHAMVFFQYLARARHAVALSAGETHYLC